MIYVNGDSWTSGWPDEETFGHREFSWPHLLSIKLNIAILNDSRAASSNTRIYRRTFDYILKYQPATAIVSLTHWARQETGNAVTGKIYQCLPERDPQFFKNNWHPYLQYSNLLRQIISLQYLSAACNTNLLFVDSYDNNLIKNPSIAWFTDILKLSLAFDAMDDNRITAKFNKIIDLNNKINYNQFLGSSTFENIVSDCQLVKGHPVSDGHAKIAEHIYLKLKENNHGSSI